MYNEGISKGQQSVSSTTAKRRKAEKYEITPTAQSSHRHTAMDSGPIDHDLRKQLLSTSIRFLCFFPAQIKFLFSWWSSNHLQSTRSNESFIARHPNPRRHGCLTILGSTQNWETKVPGHFELNLKQPRPHQGSEWHFKGYLAISNET